MVISEKLILDHFYLLFDVLDFQQFWIFFYVFQYNFFGFVSLSFIHNSPFVLFPVLFIFFRIIIIFYFGLRSYNITMTPLILSLPEVWIFHIKVVSPLPLEGCFFQISAIALMQIDIVKSTKIIKRI